MIYFISQQPRCEGIQISNLSVVWIQYADEPQHLCPEESTLGLLDDLLVHRLGRVIHDHGALLVVDLGINTCVADQVDNPLLALILVQAETGGEIPSPMSVLILIIPIYDTVTYLMSIRWWILQ